MANKNESKQEKKLRRTKRWPKGAKKSHLVTVQVRDFEPSPTLASAVTIAEFRRVRRTATWWKRHIEELLRIEAMYIKEGYQDLLEVVRDLRIKLDREFKNERQRKKAISQENLRKFETVERVMVRRAEQSSVLPECKRKKIPRTERLRRMQASRDYVHSGCRREGHPLAK